MWNMPSFQEVWICLEILTQRLIEEYWIHLFGGLHMGLLLLCFNL
ncbi:hypothetical protein CsSME_00011421 [Camellia sinensis var. sinensis]